MNRGFTWPMRNALPHVAALALIVPGVVRGEHATARGPSEPQVLVSWESLADVVPEFARGVRAIRVFGGEVWVGTEQGLHHWNGEHWRSWRHDDGLPWPYIKAIDLDPLTRDVWLGAWGGGLIRFSAGRFDQFTQFNSGLAGDLVFDVVADGRFLWAATNGGVSRYDIAKDQWRLYFERRADRSDVAVVSLARADHQLYAAAWYGNVYTCRADADDESDAPMSACRSVTIGPKSDGDHPQSTSGVAVSNGHVWIVTKHRLWHKGPESTWASIDVPPTGGGETLVRGIHPATNGRVFIAADDGLDVLFDPTSESWLTYQAADRDHAGTVVLSRPGAQPEAKRLASLPEFGRVRCVAVDGEVVWVGTDRGLWRGSGARDWRALPMPVESVERVGPAEREQSLIGDDGEDAEVDAIAVAAYGKAMQTITLPGAGATGDSVGPGLDTLAIQLALDAATDRGGYHGRIPFRLVTGHHGYAGFPWSLPEDDFVRFAARTDVFGVLAAIDTNSRMISAVASVAETPVVNVAGATPSLDVREHPWMFRCPIAEISSHRALLEYLVAEHGVKRIAVLKTPNGDARRHLNLFAEAAHSVSSGSEIILTELTCDLSEETLDARLRTIEKLGSGAVLTWCDADASARILRHMRERAMTQLFVGGPELADREFARKLHVDPGAVVALFPCAHSYDSKAQSTFETTYLDQNSRARSAGRVPPEGYAAYDATAHLLSAIALSPPDRDAIRVILRRLSGPRAAVLEGSHWRHVALDAP